MPTIARLLLQFLPGLVALAAALVCQIEAAHNLRHARALLAHSQENYRA